MKITQLPYHPHSEHIFAQIHHLDNSVWLDSGKPQSTLGRFDIISALPNTIVKPQTTSELLAMSKALESQYRVSELPFCGGWIGYLAYEFNHRKLQVKQSQPTQDTAWFGWYTWAVIVDHLKQETHLIIAPDCHQETEKHIKDLLTSAPVSHRGTFSCTSFTHNESKGQYTDSLAQIRQYLIAGDCYQVNYSQRFSAQFSGCPLTAYLLLRDKIPSPFSAYLNIEAQTILSISPERFIEIDGISARTQPIKGTIKREQDLHLDEKAKQGLLKSEKNRAENVMIVDLLRNDFSLHCLPNTVKVSKLFEVQSFANVHHLVSTIEGTLPDSVSHIEFIMDCFPGGSITGAPKKRAMEIIDELEHHSRGPYCGSIGYFSCNGKSDFNIAIRTLQINQQNIFAWAGGGIVYDSNADEEYQESLTKILALLQVLEDHSGP